jgi:hypothetical protein
MANRKEVHFFDTEKHFQTPEINYAAYHSRFCPKDGHKILGEATPSYMYWHAVPGRIWQYNPDIKIIFVLRNPIERAYSHWNMSRHLNLEHLSFWDAIHQERKRCRKARPYQHRGYSYIDRGFYSQQLRRFWTYFPKDQTLILKYEDLRENPREALERVYSFLGLSSAPGVAAKMVRSSPYICAMSRKEREYLQNIFQYEIRNLERLLGWDCSGWLEKTTMSCHLRYLLCRLLRRPSLFI